MTLVSSTASPQRRGSQPRTPVSMQRCVPNSPSSVPRGAGSSRPATRSGGGSSCVSAKVLCTARGSRRVADASSQRSRPEEQRTLRPSAAPARARPCRPARTCARTPSARARGRRSRGRRRSSGGPELLCPSNSRFRRGGSGPEAEAAAYFLCSEALANVAKYASASRVAIRIAAADGRLEVEVADDGIGGADPARGFGLRGLRDRVEALGGTLARRQPPTGDADRGDIPLEPLARVPLHRRWENRIRERRSRWRGLPGTAARRRTADARRRSHDRASRSAPGRPPTTYGGGSGLARAADVVAGLSLLAAGLAMMIVRRRGSIGIVALLAGAAWFAPDWVGWEEAAPLRAQHRDGGRTVPGAAPPSSRVGGAERAPRFQCSPRRRCRPLRRGRRRQHRRGAPARSVPRPVLLEQLHRERLPGATGAGARAPAPDRRSCSSCSPERWLSRRLWSGDLARTRERSAASCCPWQSPGRPSGARLAASAGALLLRSAESARATSSRRSSSPARVAATAARSRPRLERIPRIADAVGRCTARRRARRSASSRVASRVAGGKSRRPRCRGRLPARCLGALRRRCRKRRPGTDRGAGPRCHSDRSRRPGDRARRSLAWRPRRGGACAGDRRRRAACRRERAAPGRAARATPRPAGIPHADRRDRRRRSAAPRARPARRRATAAARAHLRPPCRPLGRADRGDEGARGRSSTAPSTKAQAPRGAARARTRHLPHDPRRGRTRAGPLGSRRSRPRSPSS